MKMRRPLKHKGFINVPRRLTLLLKEGKLDFGDYGFYIFLLQEVDWFKGRKTFGCVAKTNLELSIDSGCHPATIGRRIEKLKDNKLIEKTEEGFIRIVQFEKFTMAIVIKLAKQEVATLQEDFAQTQSIIAESQPNIATSQLDSHENYAFSGYSPLRDEYVSNEEDVSPEDIPF